MIRFKLNWSLTQDDDPFVGTDTIEVRVSYSQCINQFYLADSPSYQFNGVDGQPVSDAWLESQQACDAERYPGLIDCDVVGFEQIFLAPQSPDTTAGFFRMTLKVNNDQLTGRSITVGPLPGPGITGATCDGAPEVSIDNETVKGYDANGDQLWEVSSFQYTKFRVGQTDVGGINVKTL